MNSNSLDYLHKDTIVKHKISPDEIGKFHLRFKVTDSERHEQWQTPISEAEKEFAVDLIILALISV